MKKNILLLLIICLSILPCVYADNANSQVTQIKMNIRGIEQQKHYFLCLPSIGCLSMHAATVKDKIYTIHRPIEVRNMFVTNLNSMRLTRQKMPDSCKVTVNTGQTFTITGTLIPGEHDQAHINQLQCSVS
ncbi:MAG TPA: hypothetical protein VHZ76_04115 [Gammaproteobacteria bacterium]|jgi:hypothetical protein|nr:hypothetical protein [Gammaproteobacteria bacterium]